MNEYLKEKKLLRKWKIAKEKKKTDLLLGSF